MKKPFEQKILRLLLSSMN